MVAKSELVEAFKPITIISAYYGNDRPLRPLTVGREHGFSNFLMLETEAS